MTKDELKAIWAAPIRSKAEYDKAYNATHSDLDRLPSINLNFPEGGPRGLHLNVSTESLWPMWREKWREVSGVYPPATEVIELLRSSYGMAGQYFPHVSPSDPAMIAYTPDRACAEGDRQIKTTMGKFLRKFLLVVTDTEVARLEAAHKADMDPSFNVARTIEEIENVYTTMVGDTGCMRYNKSNWGYRQYHPSAVYTGPGLGVAWLPDINGRARARAVIYDNPADPADKRYVRLYGDHNSLRRRLEMAGYRVAGLKGAKLRALQDNDDMKRRNTYIMPYLDLPGGSGGPEEGGYVIKFAEDKDLITVIDQDAAQQFASAGLSYAGARSTGGAVTLLDVTMGDKTWTCTLTGVTYSVFDRRPIDVMLDDGTVGKVARDTLDEHGFEYEIRRYDKETGQQSVLRCTRVGREAFCVPGYQTYFNDDATRERFGIWLMSPTYYKTDAGGPMYYKGTVMVLPNGEKIFKSAAVLCYKDSLEPETHHLSEIPELRKQGYLNASPTDSTPCLVHKNHPKLVVMPSGRRAIDGIHGIRKDIFGEWVYKSRATSVSLLGTTVYYDGTIPADRMPDVATVENMHGYLMDELTACGERARNLWLRGRLVRGVGSSDNSMYIDSESKLRYNRWGTYDRLLPTMEMIVAAIDRINIMTKDEWDVQIGGTSWGKARLWARCSRILIDQIDRALKAKADADIAAAEANAVSPDDERVAIAA